VLREVRLQVEGLIVLRAVRRQMRRIDDLRVLVDELDRSAGVDPADDGAAAPQMVIAVDRSIRVLGPRQNACIPRSLMLMVLWSRRGRPATFVSGVKRDGGTLRGHAWIEAPDLDAALGGRATPAESFSEIFRQSNRRVPTHTSSR
jgi:hypothetical protein